MPTLKIYRNQNLSNGTNLNENDIFERNETLSSEIGQDTDISVVGQLY